MTLAPIAIGIGIGAFVPYRWILNSRREHKERKEKSQNVFLSVYPVSAFHTFFAANL